MKEYRHVKNMVCVKVVHFMRIDMPKKSIEEVAAKINLKPCPICENPTPRRYEWTDGCAMIECWEDYHLIRVFGDTLDDAAERWNRRGDGE